METPRPKPAPPKVAHLNNPDGSIIDVDTPNGELPPLNLKSPDGTRVITVKDQSKAQSLVNKGWTVTTEKKTPYVRPEHMSDRPLAHHEGLQKLIAELGTAEKPLRYKNNSHRRTNKKRISLNKKENN